GSRILVEAAAYPAFVERFVEAAKKLRVGDPLEPGTDLGALVSRGQFDKVMSYIALARQEGGRVLCGGQQADVGGRCRGGCFVQPTVRAELGPDCRVNQEEIFGPVVTVAPFASEAEAVRLANGTPYGLSASLWTRDLARAHRVAEKLDAGTVWVNCWL